MAKKKDLKDMTLGEFFPVFWKGCVKGMREAVLFAAIFGALFVLFLVFVA